MNLQKKYPNLILIEGITNNGVCVARNICLNEAKGQFIWFVDPDDLIIPHIANFLISEAINNSADFLATNYLRIPETYTLPYREEKVLNKRDLWIVEKGENYLPTDSNGRPMSAVWAGIFRRSFLIENSLKFREGMIAQEDTLFYYEFAQYNPIIIKYEGPAYCYRIRSGSVMHSKSEARYKGYYKSMCIMLNVYNDYSKSDAHNNSILREKINHTQENIVYCLVRIKDSDFVHREMRKLKKEGLYPFPTRWEVLRGNSGIINKVNSVLLPHSVFFWILHYLNKLIDRCPYLIYLASKIK